MKIDSRATQVDPAAAGVDLFQDHRRGRRLRRGHQPARVSDGAIQPDQVLKEMWENPRRGYDAVVVKAFINLIGIYPVGRASFSTPTKWRSCTRESRCQPGAPAGGARGHVG